VVFTVIIVIQYINKSWTTAERIKQGIADRVFVLKISKSKDKVPVLAFRSDGE